MESYELSGQPGHDVRRVPSRGGATVTCHHTVTGDGRPTILVALPFGVPAGVAQAAFETLGPEFAVATWESRFVLDLSHDFDGSEPFDPSDHVADVTAILDDLEIEKCHLVGYCSGAGISLLAARTDPDRFESLILVNGEFQLFRRGCMATDYERSIDAFLPEVARSRTTAGFIFNKMSDISSASNGGDHTELDRQINLPFSSEEYLFRYATNYMAYRDYDAIDAAGGVPHDTFVLSGRRDIHASVEQSAAVAAALDRSTFSVDDDGDHYEFCRAASRTLDQIASFLRDLTTAGSKGGGRHA
jgi:pimeloyl-ACP methyl ester carboxylesterase